MLRETVFQYLSYVSPSDPRNRRLWDNLQARSSNPRLFQTIRSFFEDIWQGKRPDRLRRETLLVMYQSPDTADQATVDYILQAFYGPGPRFELNLSPTARARALSIWRTRLSRFD